MKQPQTPSLENETSLGRRSRFLGALRPPRAAPRNKLPMDVQTALEIAQPLAPRMHPEELSRFLELLAGTRRYLEFGMGGSTVLAAAHPLERIWCVEANREWIERCSSHQEVATALAKARVTLRHADIGPIKGWGYPAASEYALRWPEYYLGIWREIPCDTLDLVFVDGRWRVECILQALLRVSCQCTLALHDFSPKRPKYNAILEFVDVIDRTRTLLTFRRKSDIDWYRLMEQLPRYAREAG